MLSKKMSALVAVSVLSASSAAVAQTAQPLSLANAPVIQAFSPNQAGALDSRNGFGIYIIGAIVLGITGVVVILVVRGRTDVHRGIGHLLRLERGAVEAVASAVALDPTFALGHAALALLGHEFCAPVDVASRLRDARLHARRSTERERSHVHAVDRHLAGDSAPLVRHLERHPADALLLSVAVPTIAFAGVTTVPEQAWRIVEQCGPAYGNDWWYAGLLAFMRQEQGLFDEAMDLSRASLAAEPAAGHSAHARAHAHYETGDHAAGLAWMDGWVTGDGASIDSLSHFAWHAALHELSLGDLDAVRRRYDAQLRPHPGMGCRSLVDSGSLLWRWALTPGSGSVAPPLTVVSRTLRLPSTRFNAS